MLSSSFQYPLPPRLPSRIAADPHFPADPRAGAGAQPQIYQKAQLPVELGLLHGPGQGRGEGARSVRPPQTVLFLCLD